MNKNENASVSLVKIMAISIIFIFITGIGVMASSSKISSVKIILSSGYEMTVLTAKTKVADILNENHISLEEDEVAVPGLEEEISENKTIRIVNETDAILEKAEEEKVISSEEILSSYGTIVEKLVTEQEVIPFETITKEATGEGTKQNKVIQKGKNGLKEVTYKVKYQNDEEIETLDFEDNKPSLDDTVEMLDFEMDKKVSNEIDEMLDFSGGLRHTALSTD